MSRPENTDTLAQNAPAERRLTDIKPDELAGQALLSDVAIDAFERLVSAGIRSLKDIELVESVARAVVFHTECRGLSTASEQGPLAAYSLVTPYDYGPLQFSSNELPPLASAALEDAMIRQRKHLSDAVHGARSRGEILETNQGEEARARFGPEVAAMSTSSGPIFVPVTGMHAEAARVAKVLDWTSRYAVAYRAGAAFFGVEGDLSAFVDAFDEDEDPSFGMRQVLGERVAPAIRLPTLLPVLLKRAPKTRADH